MHECILYKSLKGKSVQCFACNHRCIIKENYSGICGVRKNIEGKLCLLVYGVIISENIDPIEKKPLFNFLPHTNTYSIGTIGCNFKCDFCQNYGISQVKEIIGKKISAQEIVKRALKSGCKSISYTYNEPTIFAEFVKEIAVLAKEKGLKNILVTNGYMTKECMDFLGDYIDAMNIDLKSLNEDFYRKLCKSKLSPVLETIKCAYKKGIHIEITTLLIPGENDSEKELKEIVKFTSGISREIPWHISRFFPMYKMKNKDVTSIDSLRKAEEIGKKYLKYVYVGNVW